MGKYLPPLFMSTIVRFFERRRILLSASVLGTALVSMMPGASYAAIVSYQFEGVWDSGSAIYSGTTFDGVISFDTSQPDHAVSDTYGEYYPLGEITFHDSLGMNLSSGQDNLQNISYTGDFWNESIFDNTTGFLNGNPLSYFYSQVIIRGDKTDDGILPIFTSGIDLSKNTYVYMAYVDSSSISEAATGHLTSFSELSPVPLPPALPALASGLGILGFLGWRRKSRREASV
jgi:hypothetical protein